MHDKKYIVRKLLEAWEESKHKRDRKGKFVKVGTAALGAYATKKLVVPAYERITGITNLYHGTSPEHKKLIVKTGFDPSRGGTGPASQAYIELSNEKGKLDKAIGKTYFTKHPREARSYIAQQDPKSATYKINRAVAKYHTNLSDDKKVQLAFASMFDPKAAAMEMAKEIKKDVTLKDRLKASLIDRSRFQKGGMKGLVKVRIPYEMWEKNFHLDPEYSSSKNVAAYTEEKIIPKFIKGGKGYRKHYIEMLKNVPQYVKKYPKRFMGGVGLATMAVPTSYITLKSLANRKPKKK